MFSPCRADPSSAVPWRVAQRLASPRLLLVACTTIHLTIYYQKSHICLYNGCPDPAAKLECKSTGRRIYFWRKTACTIFAMLNIDTIARPSTEICLERENNRKNKINFLSSAFYKNLQMFSSVDKGVQREISELLGNFISSRNIQVQTVIGFFFHKGKNCSFRTWNSVHTSI
jgi:hypothetical protein